MCSLTYTLSYIAYCLFVHTYYNKQRDKYSTRCFIKEVSLMNIFKSKLLWIAPIAGILLLIIFSLAFYPAYNPKPKKCLSQLLIMMKVLIYKVKK